MSKVARRYGIFKQLLFCFRGFAYSISHTESRYLSWAKISTVSRSQIRIHCSANTDSLTPIRFRSLASTVSRMWICLFSLLCFGLHTYVGFHCCSILQVVAVFTNPVSPTQAQFRAHRSAFAGSLTQFRVCGFAYSVYYVLVYIHCCSLPPDVAVFTNPVSLRSTVSRSQIRIRSSANTDSLTQIRFRSLAYTVSRMWIYLFSLLCYSLHTYVGFRCCSILQVVAIYISDDIFAYAY